MFRFPLSTPHPLLPAVPAEKRKLTTSTSCRIADTEAFLFQQVAILEATKHHGKEAVRMDTKTIVGIVLVVAVAGVLAFLKIRSRRK